LQKKETAEGDHSPEKTKRKMKAKEPRGKKELRTVFGCLFWTGKEFLGQENSGQEKGGARPPAKRGLKWGKRKLKYHRKEGDEIKC